MNIILNFYRVENKNTFERKKICKNIIYDNAYTTNIIILFSALLIYKNFIFFIFRSFTVHVYNARKKNTNLSLIWSANRSQIGARIIFTNQVTNFFFFFIYLRAALRFLSLIFHSFVFMYHWFLRIVVVECLRNLFILICVILSVLYAPTRLYSPCTIYTFSVIL